MDTGPSSLVQSILVVRFHFMEQVEVFDKDRQACGNALLGDIKRTRHLGEGVNFSALGSLIRGVSIEESQEKQQKEQASIEKCHRYLGVPRKGLKERHGGVLLLMPQADKKRC